MPTDLTEHSEPSSPNPPSKKSWRRAPVLWTLVVLLAVGTVVAMSIAEANQDDQPTASQSTGVDAFEDSMGDDSDPLSDDGTDCATDPDCSDLLDGDGASDDLDGDGVADTTDGCDDDDLDCLGLSDDSAGDSAEDTGGPDVETSNAADKAQQYLDAVGGFSRESLITQLTDFDKFPRGEAARAVDSLNIDYNDQAAQKAKQYQDAVGGFSHASLMTQLTEFDKFTEAQAEYGVQQVGL